MRFNNNEYEIKKSEYYSAITISRTALESWRDYYKKMAGKELEKERCTNSLYGNYMGAASAITDILVIFDDDEPNDNAPLAVY